MNTFDIGALDAKIQAAELVIKQRHQLELRARRAHEKSVKALERAQDALVLLEEHKKHCIQLEADLCGQNGPVVVLTDRNSRQTRQFVWERVDWFERFLRFWVRPLGEQPYYGVLHTDVPCTDTVANDSIEELVFVEIKIDYSVPIQDRTQTRYEWCMTREVLAAACDELDARGGPRDTWTVRRRLSL